MEELRSNFPVRIAEALALLAGMPASQDEYEQMLWLVRRFTEDKDASDLFEERFRLAQSAYEALAPDPALADHLGDYGRLVRLRALWRHGARLDDVVDDFDLDEYGAHTRALVRQAISLERLRREVPVYRLDGTFVERIQESAGNPAEKAAVVESAIEYEIRERGQGDPVARSLAERLERLRRRKRESTEDTLDLLNGLLRLSGHWAAEQDEADSLGLTKRAQGFLSVARASDAVDLREDQLLDLSRRIDAVVEANATFPEWIDRDDILRGVRREIIGLLFKDDTTKALATTAFVDDVIAVAIAATR
jgi:type I restriction enzyme, R subunit